MIWRNRTANMTAPIFTFARVAQKKSGSHTRSARSISSSARSHLPTFAEGRTFCACGGGCPRCRKTARRAMPEPAGKTPAVVREVLSAPGESLAPEMQRQMETRFGEDFSGVRVHAGARPAESARALGAIAYTADGRIVFGAGQYQPGTGCGRRLLAHELAHVVQQREGRVADRTGPGVRINGDAHLEAEANAMGGRAACGEVARDPGVGLGRPRGSGGGANKRRVGTVIQRKVDPQLDTADAVIDVPVAWVFEIPDPHAKKIAELKKGAVVKVLGFSGDFVKIVWQSGVAYISDFDPALSQGDWIVIVPDATLAAGAKPGVSPHSGQPDAAGNLVVFTSKTAKGPETHYQTDAKGADVVEQGPLSSGVTSSLVDTVCKNVADSRAKIHARYLQSNATGFWATPGTEKALETSKGLNPAQQKEIDEFQKANPNWAEGPKATRDYHQWLASALPTGVKDSKDPRWQIFQRVFAWEGDPSTINAYDRANVTLGVGFAPPAQVQSMIERVFAKSPEAKAAFLHAGITIDNNHQFLVVDPDKKWKLRGHDAELYIRANKPLLSLLENVAQGVFQEEFANRPAPSSDPKQAVLDAQFETFAANALKGIPASILNSADLDFKALATHSVHGLSGFYNWSDLSTLSGLQAMIQHVWDIGPNEAWFNAIVPGAEWRKKPDKTKDCGWKSKEKKEQAEKEKKEKAEQEAAKKAQRKAEGDGEPDPNAAIASDRGGVSVDGKVRRRVELVTGRDLSAARAHTAEESVRSARSLKARAYTVGDHLHFAAGHYRPGTADGDRLIAHELAHAAQQQGAGSSPPGRLEVNQPGEPLEQEADRVAEAATSGGAQLHVTGCGPKLQRDPAPVIDANADVIGGFHPYDGDAANKFNAGRALKFDMAGIQAFLHVPMVMPREGYYFNKDKYGEKTAASTVEKLYPDSKERAKHFTFFAGENWKDIIDPVTTATLDWQIDWNARNPPFKLEENAKLDDPTLKAFKTRGYDPTGKSIDWKAVDLADFNAIRSEEQQARKEVERGGGSSFALRQAIVNLAQSQVGTVFSSNRGDGRKRGWERILRYYEIAYEGTSIKVPAKGKTPESEMPYYQSQFGENTEDIAGKGPTDRSLSQPVKDTMAAGKFSFPNPGGPWSWCAIFAMWAVRAATGNGRWDGKVNGLEWVADPKLKNAQRGDLLYIISDNQHHCILAHEPDPAQPDGPYETIEGNLEGQEVRRCKRWVSANLHGYYRAVKDD
jgi:bacterioferritin-associated ferredoxin